MPSGASNRPFPKPHLDYSAVSLQAMPSFAAFEQWMDQQLAVLEDLWPQPGARTVEDWRRVRRPARRKPR